MTKSKHVEPIGACWRTRVQFPPPPPPYQANQAPTGAFFVFPSKIPTKAKRYFSPFWVVAGACLSKTKTDLSTMLALFNSVYGTWVRFRVWDAGSNPGLGIEQGNQRHHISHLFPVHQSPISASLTNESSAITGAVNAWGRLGVGVRLGRVQKTLWRAALA